MYRRVIAAAAAATIIIINIICGGGRRIIIEREDSSDYRVRGPLAAVAAQVISGPVAFCVSGSDVEVVLYCR